MKRTLKLSKWLMFLCFGLALVLWLGFGGRSEFVASEGPYSAVVYISGWLALTGLLAATVLTTGFFGGYMSNTAKRVVIRQGMRRGR